RPNVPSFPTRRSSDLGLPWAKLQPKKLLAVSASFIWPEAPDAVDRQWLCAVFANETGQTDAARQFAETAAKAKPNYREQVPLLLDRKSTRLNSSHVSI